MIILNFEDEPVRQKEEDAYVWYGGVVSVEQQVFYDREYEKVCRLFSRRIYPAAAADAEG